jgi:hypothetical protein
VICDSKRSFARQYPGDDAGDRSPGVEPGYHPASRLGRLGGIISGLSPNLEKFSCNKSSASVFFVDDPRDDRFQSFPMTLNNSA